MSFVLSLLRPLVMFMACLSLQTVPSFRKSFSYTVRIFLIEPIYFRAGASVVLNMATVLEASDVQKHDIGNYLGPHSWATASAWGPKGEPTYQASAAYLMKCNGNTTYVA